MKAGFGACGPGKSSAVGLITSGSVLVVRIRCAQRTLQNHYFPRRGAIPPRSTHPAKSPFPASWCVFAALNAPCKITISRVGCVERSEHAPSAGSAKAGPVTALKILREAAFDF
ncbi:MAG: hypothetical protein KGY49_13420, partial [Wenzhouxiangellaceae bacterium]|nr:hypothetical protein [Wenzhouxiangellaceae bacterium]